MKVAKWCVFGIGIFLVLAILAALILNTIFGHQFRKALAKIQAEGRPTTVAEMLPARMQADQDAAPLLEKAASLLTHQPIPAVLQELSKIGEEFSGFEYWNRNIDLLDFSENRREVLMRLLDNPDNKALYSLLSEASQKQGYTGHPKYSEMSQLVRLLVLKAAAAAYRGDGREAGQALLEGFRLANLLKREPGMNQLLVSEMCSSIQWNSLYRVTNGVDLPDDVLQALEPELRNSIDATKYVRTMDEERTIALEGYRTLLDGSYRDVMTVVREIKKLPPAYAWIYRRSGLLHRDIAVYLELQSNIQDQCRMASNKSIPFLRWEQIEKQIPAFCPLSGIMLRESNAILNMKVRREAIVQVTRVGLALKRYKLKNGVYPDTLTSLTPSLLDGVPVDPYTGSSLSYRTEGDGFVLYSLGHPPTPKGGQEQPLIFWAAMR